ncbi:DNA repair protein RadA [Vibrio sp. D431a]|uniref:DNA repair protein RadA n=1 Tax=Vibrio sp. D431a TaxID=2837388 RepID=UPI00255373A6|nr:DNA repair protein RadA [Vibrio sp. D431a]MDK9795082.1 DNA repair protein RadA [Vibrio sp. D431a]
MAKAKKSYVCNECGMDFARWQGQCNSCGSWNTISEIVLTNNNSVSAKLNDALGGRQGGYAGGGSTKAKTIDEIDLDEIIKYKTGQPELDRVLGGGVTAGSIVLISGDPGAGKTTLLTQVVHYMHKSLPSMYNTSEESLPQWVLRAKGRLGLAFSNDTFFMGDTDNVETLIKMVEDNKVKFLVTDSIQALSSSSENGRAGGVTQVKTCASLLTRLCKQHGVTILLVGQVTKNSEMAGPQELKHIIDATVHIEVTDGDVRFLRSDKNRFGNTDQVGVFQMTGDKGMVSVTNPSRLFLSNSEEEYSGSAVTVIKDGSRNILIEIQSLVTDVEGEKSMKNCIGVSYSRLSLITQVLKKHGGIKTYYDINVSLVGGIKLPDTETSTDLSVAASFISSVNNKVVPRDSVFIGEVALTGEIRQVRDGLSRVKECITHRKRQIYIPHANYCKKMQSLSTDECKIIPLKKIKDLIEALS